MTKEDERYSFKEQTFESTKEEIIKILKRPGFNALTFKEHINDLRAYMEYLKVTSELPDLLDLTDDVDRADSKESDHDSESEPVDDRLLGVFQKNLSGGVVKNDAFKDGVLFIGESWVREHGITDGDVLEVFGYNGYRNGASGVSIDEVRDPVVDQKIIAFKYGVVEDVYSTGSNERLDIHRRYIVKRNVHGEELGESYRFTTDEIEKHDLKAGDIVDIAWYANNESACKMIWKHDVSSTIEDTVSSKILNNPIEKEPKQEPEKTESEERVDDTLFEGLTICLVGIDIYKDNFKKVVEERSGEFIWVDPKWSQKRREAAYRKSDIVALGLQRMSHDASNHAIAFTKKKNIPHCSFDGHGTGPFVLQIMNKLKLF